MHQFIAKWKKGDIPGITQNLTEDCLVLDPLWALPGSKPVLVGIAEVSSFRRYFCRTRDYTKLDILNIASHCGQDEDRVYLHFRETNARTPLVWQMVNRAIKTRLLFPLYQSDEAGVIMFKLTKDARIKEIVCFRKPPEVEDISDKVLQDDYAHMRSDAAPQYLSLFDRM